MSTMAEVISTAIWQHRTVMIDAPEGEYGSSLTYRSPEELAELVAETLLRAGYGKLADAFPIIRDLVDPDPCEFDHHGGCQAHGYLSLEPGETCPHHDAKQWMKAHGGASHE